MGGQLSRRHFESLEERRMLTLLGVIDEMVPPLVSYNSTGMTAYNAGAFDVTAKPLSIEISDNAGGIVFDGISTAAKVEMHVRLDGNGALVGGVNPGDAVNQGQNLDGHDFYVTGRAIIDVDGDGTIDVDTTGVLLTGEVVAFGYSDGGIDDFYDFRFAVTGGLLAGFFAGQDIGVHLVSHNSNFTADFTTSFGGTAEGVFAPIPKQEEPFSISGKKVVDRTGDGVTPDDTPLGGVTINLLRNGELFLSTVTGPDGSYSFTGLLPGFEYTVEEVVPVGYAQTVGIGGYAIPSTNAGDSAGNNFANFKLISISGKKVEDCLGNGFGWDDSALGGFTILLFKDNGDGLFTADDGAAIDSKVTAADGTFSFTDLGPGTYFVKEVVPDGWMQTGGPAFYVVNAFSGENVRDRNFANFKLVKIEGTKYHDKTGNSFSYDDTRLAGVTINLYLVGNSTPIRTTVTGPDGRYKFEDLGPGLYYVQEVVPEGWIQTGGNLGYLVLGTSGTHEQCKDFANYKKPSKGSISGNKYLDKTGNGLTADDTPLGGVKIRLYRDVNGDGKLTSADGNPVATAITEAGTGAYSFDNLGAGTYFVKEDLTGTTYIRTAPTNSDTYTVKLAAGEDKGGFVFANYDAKDCLCDISSFYFLVNGKKTYDLRGNTNQGDKVQVVFTVKKGGYAELSLVSYKAPAASFDANTAYLQEVYQVETGKFGPGTHVLTVYNPNCYYQVDFVCGPVIDRFGPAGSNIFYTPQNRLISADNDGCNACFCGTSSISGIVYYDKNNDGDLDANEDGIKNVMVKLTGYNDLGQYVEAIEYTDSDGAYLFEGLRDGTYKVTEVQPAGYNDGKDSIGSLDGSNSTNDVFSNIVITGGNKNGINYNFGETKTVTQTTTLTCNMTATIGFWQNKNGQALIEKMNGSKNATNLGKWLATNLPNLFGNTVGADNLYGKTNTQVAEYFVKVFKVKGPKIEAQVLATALAVYVTDRDLAGGTYASSYGFIVNSNGTGVATYNVGSYGSVIGLTNNQSYTISQILAATNKIDAFDASSTTQSKVTDLFANINEKGDI